MYCETVDIFRVVFCCCWFYERPRLVPVCCVRLVGGCDELLIHG